MVKKAENCGNINGLHLLLLLLITPFITTVAEGAIATVYHDTVYQELEGFGGSAVYDVGRMTDHPNKEIVYDYLFRDLGLDIIRIRNTYDYPDTSMNDTKEIVAEARESGRNPNMKTFLVPWSPPDYLKSNGNVSGGTLAGGPSSYVYDSYATWWLNSLTSWASGGNGLTPDYISIQNEPDWGDQDQACMFEPTESDANAGYDQAFEAVYNKIDGNVSPMPKFLAPETAGFGSSEAYIDAVNDINQIDHIYGFSHHLYGDGSYDNPDGMIPGMQSYATNYGDEYNKPLFQTEYASSGTPIFDHAPLLAQHIYNCLVHEGVTSYYHWTLFRNGSYATGGMINLGYPSGYTVRDIYWYFKHYSYFTDPGWYRVGTWTNSTSLLMTAFKSPGNTELTVVILNKSSDASVNLAITFNNFSPRTSEVYRSSSTEQWASLGAFANPWSFPIQSITTIHMSGTPCSDCNEVQAEGYRLTSDLNGDCYVDLKDMGVVAQYWLNKNCAAQDDCEGADFEPTDGDVDFSDLDTFLQQWLWCNDPENLDCINW